MKKNYTLIKDFIDPVFLDIYNINLEKLVETLDSNNVFKCEHGIKQIQNLHLEPSLIWYDILINRVKSNLNLQSAKVLNMQYFIKYPNYKITSPHQDGAYFNEPNKNIITCWLPLMDVKPENSCIHYLNTDTKLTEVLEHKKVGTTVRTRTGTKGYSQYCELYDLAQYEPISMSIGDLLIHDQFALHYANENSTDKKRVALTLILELDNEI